MAFKGTSPLSHLRSCVFLAVSAGLKESTVNVARRDWPPQPGKVTEECLTFRPRELLISGVMLVLRAIRSSVVLIIVLCFCFRQDHTLELHDGQY